MHCAGIGVEVFGQPRRAVGVDALEDLRVADMDLALLQDRRHRHDQREFGEVALEIVAHADHGAIAVAREDHLRGFVEELRVGLADVEAAEAPAGVDAKATASNNAGDATPAERWAGRAWRAPKGWTTGAVNAGGPESGLESCALLSGRRAWRAADARTGPYLCPPGEGVYNGGMGDSRVNLTHHFLIAMPSMADPHFAHTLIYICEHNDQRRARHRRQQADRHDAVGAVRADQIPLGDSGLREAKSTTAGRCRSTAASFSIGRSAAGSRRWRSATIWA